MSDDPPPVGEQATTGSVLPDPSEYAALTPTPGSPVWRAFNDVRLLSTSGYATLLQVAHPTVGHGVHQYSSFTSDPWGRLLRTLERVAFEDYVIAYCPDCQTEGRVLKDRRLSRLLK